MIGGAVVPALINIGGDWARIPATIISLIVGLMVSLETVHHFGDQWPIYRSTEQLLRREYYLFTTGRGVYEGKGSDEAYKQFVERVEDMIDNETRITIRIMSAEVKAVNQESNNLQQGETQSQLDQPTRQQSTPAVLKSTQTATSTAATQGPPSAPQS